MIGYVYILQSEKNNRYYIGSTVHLQRRVDEHNAGETKATRNLRPWKLVFAQEYTDLSLARKIEYMLKKFKSRIILEKIIADGVIKLSR
jgi:putative endonuclease